MLAYEPSNILILIKSRYFYDGRRNERRMRTKEIIGESKGFCLSRVPRELLTELWLGGSFGGVVTH